MKHRTGLTGRTGAIYRSWVLVKCVWCGAYYWFRLRKCTGYGFRAFLTCILLLLLLIQCKISLYLRPVRPVRCFVTPGICVRLFLHRSTSHVVVNFFFSSFLSSTYGQTSTSWRLLTSGCGRAGSAKYITKGSRCLAVVLITIAHSLSPQLVVYI